MYPLSGKLQVFRAAMVFALVLVPVRFSFAENPAIETLETLLSQPHPEIDLARAKLTIDKLIDPAIDIEAGVAWFDQAARVIEQMGGPDAGDQQKMAAIRTFVYKSGPWNNFRPFAYDHDDPLGEKISNKLMTNYLASRRGNCVTMPFLVILLADRLGLDVTASTAPLHVFVKFTPEDGQTINLEATSGALPARDAWYREQMPMTDTAIKNGVYMKTLRRQEMLSVMGTVLVEHYIDAGQYGWAAETADLLILLYPDYAYLHVARGTALYHIINERFYKRYPKAEDVPLEERPYLEYLLKHNARAFHTAELLGWAPEEGELRGPLPPVEE